MSQDHQLSYAGLPPHPAHQRRHQGLQMGPTSENGLVPSAGQDEFMMSTQQGNGEYQVNDKCGVLRELNILGVSSGSVYSYSASEQDQWSQSTSSSSVYDDQVARLSDSMTSLRVNQRTSGPQTSASNGYQGHFYDTQDAGPGLQPTSAIDRDLHLPTTQDAYDPAIEHLSHYEQYAPPGYDPYAAAASNVLGSGPRASGPSYTDENHLNGADIDSSFSMPRINHNGSEDEVSAQVTYSLPLADDARSYIDGISSAKSDQDDSDSMASRPSLQRSGTTGSVSLGTRRMKAVDLRAPPYTKEFIDQYRQRIKNDPDPEAHFQYAKYLIDAAKNIGANAADQRSVRKYRELLVQEALKVIRRLATQGDPYAEAQFFLANCHGTGMLGLQVDHERAYHLYLQAAKQNHAAAAYRVAVCNEIGAGTRREPPRAFAFYRKSASLGDTSAMYKLGMVLLSGGLGQPPNPREAVAWLRRAAEQADEDNPHALHELGLLHELPDSQIVPYDPAYARNLFTKAAQLGYTQSQYKLGQCYEYGSLACSVDPRKSIAWYTRAAEKGDAEAELALSGWYLTGSEGVLKQSDSEAYLWARRAANKGLSKAEYAVGYYAETGIGVKQDIELAKRWYMRAAGKLTGIPSSVLLTTFYAAQGNKRAMNRLTELKRMGNKRGLAIRPTRQQAKDECVIS